MPSVSGRNLVMSLLSAADSAYDVIIDNPWGCVWASLKSLIVTLVVFATTVLGIAGIVSLLPPDYSSHLYLVLAGFSDYSFFTSGSLPQVISRAIVLIPFCASGMLGLGLLQVELAQRIGHREAASPGTPTSVISMLAYGSVVSLVVNLPVVALLVFVFLAFGDPGSIPSQLLWAVTLAWCTFWTLNFSAFQWRVSYGANPFTAARAMWSRLREESSQYIWVMTVFTLMTLAAIVIFTSTTQMLLASSFCVGYCYYIIAPIASFVLGFFFFGMLLLICGWFMLSGWLWQSEGASLGLDVAPRRYGGITFTEQYSLAQTRRAGVAVVVLVILVAAVSIAAVDTSAVRAHWSDEAMTFHQFAYQYSQSFSGDPSPVSYGMVNATLHNPPPLHGIYTPSSFINSLVESYKLSCEFSGGTSGYEYMENSVARLISRAYLPVGMWASIDGFFPDSGSSGYRSWISEGYMHLQYSMTILPDGYVSWELVVSLETGVPVSASYLSGWVGLTSLNVWLVS